MDSLVVSDMTWVEVEKAVEEGYDAIIIPIGVVEAHGPHLPLGTDWMIPMDLSLQIAGELKALIYPPIPLGVVGSLSAYPGSASINPDTLENLLYELQLSLSRHGFKYFIIMNGHGAGDHLRAVTSACRRVWAEKKLKTIIVNWWIYAGSLTEEVFSAPGGHAGIDETALILATNPRRVKESLLSSDEVYYVKPGLDVYPSVGSILLYKKEAKRIIPSMEEATHFRMRLVDQLKKDLSALLERFRANG